MIIFELQIYLNLNVNTYSEPFVLLKYDMIWGNNTKASSNYNFPYFSENVDYNKLPGINQMTYPEIVELFFNKGVFSNMFEQIDETDQKYNESNILKMLSLLFPTKNRNLTTSSNIIFQNRAIIPSNNSSFFDIFVTQLESYLKVNNTVYTVSNVIYVNDIINHPKYRDLMNSIKKYYIAGLNENTKLLSNEKENFIKEFKKIDKSQLSNIDEKIKDIENHSNTNTNINIRINIKNAKELLDDITAIIDNENVSVDDSILSERTNDIINVFSKHLNNIKKLLQDELFSSITQNFRNIYKISKKIKLLDKVKNFYSKGSININIDDDGDDDTEMMNVINRFQPYKNVVSKIQELIEPNLISRNEKLQNLIVSYSKNTDTDNSMIRLVNKMFILLKNFEMDEKIKKNQSFIDTTEFSINEFEEFANINNTVHLEKFICEVFLNIDLIERDENNKNSVNGNCKLKSEILGNSIENLMNPKNNNYELSKYRISSKIMGGKKRNRMSKKYKMKRQRTDLWKTRRNKK